jgi:hypothetical protein
MTHISDYILVLLEDLANELEAEIDARYRNMDGKIHPAEINRYNRDMVPVNKAREALEEIRERGAE